MEPFAALNFDFRQLSVLKMPLACWHGKGSDRTEAGQFLNWQLETI